MDAQMKRGFLETCVLAALRNEDSYGYKIIRDISPYIEMTESTLYPILKRLEQDDCLSAYSVEHNSRLRKYYRITDRGRARIDEFLNEWTSIMKAYEFIRGGTTHEQT